MNKDIKEPIKIPDEFDQTARIKEIRNKLGIKQYKLTVWLEFEKQIIQYYAPFLSAARKVSQLEEENEQCKKDIEKLRQGSFF